MLQFLLFIFIFVIAIILLGVLFVGNIIRSFLGLGHRTHNHSTQEREQETMEQSSSHKQVFSEDEGEYVDFEEIKDDDKK